MMRHILIFILLTISMNTIGQGLFNKSKKFTINYTFTPLTRGGETVKCKRTPKSELKKFQETKGIDRLVGMKIMSNIINIESILEYKKNGAEGYEKSFVGLTTELSKTLIENRIELDISHYINEFKLYQKYPVKSTEKIEKEARDKKRKEEEIKNKERIERLEEERIKTAKINDSILIVYNRQKKTNDSIEQVNIRLEEEKRRQQSIVNQNKWQEQKRKEKEEFEVRQRARKEFLIQKYGIENGELISAKKVKIGWTREMCIEAWGKPRDINRTITQQVTHEQWVYSLKRYLYFDNDILTTIQD